MAKEGARAHARQHHFARTKQKNLLTFLLKVYIPEHIENECAEFPDACPFEQRRDVRPGAPRGIFERGIYSRAIAITESGLFLGSASRLARMRQDGQGLALDADRSRLLALLSVVSGYSVQADILKPIEAASDYWRRGDKALANLRLAFSALPQVAAPADADRLCLAEHLLDNGMTPLALMKALGLDTGVLDFEKYNRDQPRVPAGNGIESGRWAGGNGETVVAINDSAPGAKKPLEVHEPADDADPAQQHPHYIPINPLQGTGLPPGIGPGAFARYGITSGPGLRPSPTQQREIDALGREYGCHTCGTKEPGTLYGNFVGDHQDPTSLVSPGTRQILLPHCWRCARAQGGYVRGYRLRTR